MSDVAPDEPSDSPLTPRCAECRARLTHDQRYCVECGARRGALPAAVSELLRQKVPTRAIGAPTPVPIGTPARVPIGALRDLDETPWTPARDWLDRLSSLQPRAAAVAVMGMLAFGALVGSSLGSVAQSATGAPLVVAVSISRTQTSQANSNAGANSSSASSGRGGGGGSGGGTVTVTVPAQTAQTVTSPSSGNQGSGGGSTTTSSTPSSTLPPVKHVFMIVLSTVGYKQSFGARSADPYLARTLVKQGELLPNYYAVTQGSLANSIALISGQGPTEQTAADCPTFSDIAPGKIGKYGEVEGSGCVYPLRASTLADQLTAAGQTWKAYIEGVNGGPTGQPKTCRHPTVGGLDADQAPRPADPYVTWRNAFAYFHSLIDPTTCATDDVGLPALKSDLKSERTTPSVVWIFPGPCDDGDPQPCATGKPAGMAPADAFLRTVVPEIEHSPAYKADGLIAITADQAPQTGADADPSACCDNPKYQNLSAGPAAPGGTTTTTTTGTTTLTTTTPMTTPTTGTSTTPTTGTSATPTTGTSATPTTITTPTTSTPTTTGTTSTTTTTPTPTTTTTPPTTGTTTTPTTSTSTTTTTTSSTTTTPTSSGGQVTPTGGGGQVGLLLISQYVKPGSTDTLDYFNHFSLLGSIEDLFGLKHLGYARDPALPLFYGGVYNGYTTGG